MTARTFLDLGFPNSVQHDLPLCSSQTCCSPSPLPAVALLLWCCYHTLLQGTAWWHFFPLLLFSQYYFHQTSRKILVSPILTVPVLFRAEFSQVPVPSQGAQMEKYQGWIKMQGRIAKFTGFHSKYCCRKCCQTVQVVDVTDCTSLLALSLDPQALYSNASFKKTGFDDEERVMCLVNDLSATNLPARIQTIIPSFLCGEVSGYPYFSVDTFL